MVIKIFCLMNGILLWSASDSQSINSDILISGFLGAINMFALETEGKNIRNIALENSQWTFTNIYGIKNFFLVVETPLSKDNNAKAQDDMMAGSLIHEILKKFQSLHPADQFLTMPYDMKKFDDIRNWTLEYVKIHAEKVTRRSLANPSWLAKFENVEKLFTALYSNNPIFILTNSYIEIIDSIKLKQFQSTLEMIGSNNTLYVRNLEYEEIIQNTCINNTKSINIVDNKYRNLIIKRPGVVIDFDAQIVISGPDSNKLSKNIVNYIRSTTDSNFAIMEHLKSIIEDDSHFIINENGNENIKNKLTQIPCKICNSLISVQADNPDTYFSKSEHKPFLGMNLSTFLVAHIISEEMHYNSILLDQNGDFFGYIEAYSTPLIKKPNTNSLLEKNNMHIIQNEEIRRLKHKYLDMMLIFNKKDHWLFPVVTHMSLNLIEFTELMFEKISETLKIYSNHIDYLNITIGDKKFHVWIQNDNTYYCISLKSDDIINFFNTFMKEIMKHPIEKINLVLWGQRMNLCLKYLEENKLSEGDTPYLIRILFDDLLFSKIKIKYKTVIPRIIDRVTREYKVENDLIQPLLSGEISVFEQLSNHHLNKTKDLLNIMDFLDLRNLLV